MHSKRQLSEDQPYFDQNHPEHNVTIGQVESIQGKLSQAGREGSLGLFRVVGFGFDGETNDGSDSTSSDQCYPNNLGTANIADMYKFAEREHGNRPLPFQVKVRDHSRRDGKDLSEWIWASDLLDPNYDFDSLF